MNIILIHLGLKKINYVINTIKHLIKFKNDNIFFISETKTLNFLKKYKLDKKINFINTNNLNITDKHKTFSVNTKLDKNLQGGFWYKTTERFFYLQNFCEINKLKNIVHIENDVLIFDKLAKYTKIFEKYYDIGLTFLNHHLCVPGFIYFKNFKKVNFMCDYISQQNKYFFQNKKKNDMQLLAGMFKKYRNNNKYKIRLLPTMSNILAKECGILSKNNQPFYRYYNNFGFLFDACAIGQKIGGLNRKYHKHKGSYINPLNIFDPNNVQVIIKKTHNFKKPYIKINNKIVPLLNIHMHSKKTDYFLK